MNKCLFYGRVSSDIDFRVNGEHQSARFSIAVNRAGKEKKTDFLRMVAFGKQAELINNSFKKGNRIVIDTMAVKPEKYTDQNGNTRYPDTEFWVNAFDFVETRAEQGQTTLPTPQAPQQVSAPTQAPQSVPDDFMSVPEGIDEELPFS